MYCAFLVGKIRRHSSRTAYDCPYEKDRPYAKPIRPTKKYATLGRPKGSKSRLIFRESDTDVLGSDISILEGEVVQFTDGALSICNLSQRMGCLKYPSVYR